MKIVASSPYEFSRPFTVDRISDKPFKESITANEAERIALAKRLKLPSIKTLEAEITMQRVHPGNVVKLDGVLRADLMQTCVVSLENFPAKLEREFSAYFAETAPKPKYAKNAEEEEIELEDERAPEPIGPRGDIDLGELVTQHLSLELDPYPRKPGAAFAAPKGVEVGGEEKKNPFAVLADFRPTKK